MKHKLAKLGMARRLQIYSNYEMRYNFMINSILPGLFLHLILPGVVGRRANFCWNGTIFTKPNAKLKKKVNLKRHPTYMMSSFQNVCIQTIQEKCNQRAQKLKLHNIQSKLIVKAE